MKMNLFELTVATFVAFIVTVYPGQVWSQETVVGVAADSLETAGPERVVIRVRGINAETGKAIPHVRFSVEYLPQIFILPNGVKVYPDAQLPYSRGNIKVYDDHDAVSQSWDEDGEYSVLTLPLPIGNDTTIYINPSAVEFRSSVDGTLWERVDQTMKAREPLIFNTADLRGRVVYTFPEDILFYPFDEENDIFKDGTLPAYRREE